MIVRLALRSLAYRPLRSLLLLAGFGLGVAVMIVLLSVGEAMLAQARDERLVGGGDITVLPEGIDVEVMKTGGVGGMFFSIPNARFIDLQLLSSPRLADAVAAVAPQIEGKLLYLRTPAGREVPVLAAGELPSATRAVGAAPDLAAGRWDDDELDRRWAHPTAAELYADLDHFHRPPSDAAAAARWAEWHYFNVLSADHRRWAFLSFIVAGDVARGQGGAQVLLTLHEQGRPARRFSTAVPASRARFSTADADVALGASRVILRPDGRYDVTARARAEDGTAEATVDLVVAPAPRAYFPGASIASGDFVSGYVVPALRASASGRLCVADRCERVEGAQAYHDHNWGTWQGVTWQWGAARAGAYSFLYGRIEPPDSIAGEAPLFFYLVDSTGFRALFRPRRIAYEDGRTIVVDGRTVRVPSRATMAAVRGDDTLRVELEIEDAAGTDTRRPLVERGAAEAARRLARPYFVQMKGVARLHGRLDGRPLRGDGAGFFETYR